MLTMSMSVAMCVNELCQCHAKANAKVALLQTDHSKRIPSYGRPSEIYFSWNSGGMSIFKENCFRFVFIFAWC